MKHLWEAEHPYHCAPVSWFGRADELHAHFRSWPEFVASDGDCDPDYNLLFRWDWELPNNDEEMPDAARLSPDPYYRDCTLWLFWHAQRKGYYRWTTVEVCQADEPAIREWLKARFDHLKKLWEPLV